MKEVIQLNEFRKQQGLKYLKGTGVEIGPSYNPLIIDIEKCFVIYIDDKHSFQHLKEEISKDENIRNKVEVKEPHIFDNGEILSSMKNDSLDFIIANHVFEHLKNPLEALKNHCSKIKIGGILFYTIPDKRFNFDKTRKNTSFDHIVQDYVSGNEKSDNEHYREWFTEVGPGIIEFQKTKLELEEAIEKYKQEKRNIHFHAWDTLNMKSMFEKSIDYLNLPLKIIDHQRNGQESIFILRKKS